MSPGEWHELLVEDNAISRKVTSRCLEWMGVEVEVVVAHHGQEALDLRQAGEVVDLVLMDCQMPVMDGYEATRCIRNIERVRHLPIIALPAHAMEGERERCRDAGMDDYLAKPFQPQELIDLLSKYLGSEAEGKLRESG